MLLWGEKSMPFNRDSAFSANVKDPDNPEEIDPIVEMITLGDDLLMVKTRGIYRAITADTIDPERKYLDTRHTYEKIYSVGASNSFVARMLLQFKPIINLSFQKAERKQLLLNHVWKSNKILLDCESTYYQIHSQVMALMEKCDQTIEANKSRQVIPALPKVNDLEKYVNMFFNSGKQFLIAAYETLHIFYGMPFADRNKAHFGDHREWIKEKFGPTIPIYLVLEQDEPWVRIIAELRNAFEHPGNGQKVEIRNFSLEPNNKFSAPTWRYDLSKKGLGIQADYTDLIHDFNVHLSNLLTFFEELLVLCIQAELQDTMFEIFKKRNEDIRLECPIVYEINKRQYR